MGQGNFANAPVRLGQGYDRGCRRTAPLSRHAPIPWAIPPRRRYQRTRYFAPNELSRLCMDTLRLAAGEPLIAEEITIRIMTAKGFEAQDARLRATIRVQAGAVLKRLHRRQIATPSGKGVGATWRLSDS